MTLASCATCTLPPFLGNHSASAAIVAAPAGGNTLSGLTDHPVNSKGGGHDIDALAVSTTTSGSSSSSSTTILTSTTSLRLPTSSLTHIPNMTVTGSLHTTSTSSSSS